KYIIDVLDSEPIISETQIQFWKWISDYYCCTLGEVMDAAMPGNMKMASETKLILHPDFDNSVPLTPKEEQVLSLLHSKTAISIDDISELLKQKTVVPVIKSLYEKGLIVLQEDLKEQYKPKKELFVRHL